jgi:hypothetical protein
MHARPDSQARAGARPAARRAAQVNEVGFSFTAFRMVRGAFTVEATFEPVSPRRVAIRFARATLVPEQLQKLFEVLPANLRHPAPPAPCSLAVVAPGRACLQAVHRVVFFCATPVSYDPCRYTLWSRSHAEGLINSGMSAESWIRLHAIMMCLQANYELLLSIFNPEGWLDTTYVDDQHRVGRDDKGNVFVLERC